MATPPPPPLVLSLSGASSTGKSTILHLLSSLLPTNLIPLRLDDFCKDFSSLPLSPSGSTLDGDSRHSVDYAKFLSTLRFVKREGRMPEVFESWMTEEMVMREEREARERVDVTVVEECRAKLRGGGVLDGAKKRKLVLVDGFLRYHDTDVRREMDTMLFLRGSKEVVLRRRMGRPGYGAEAKQGEFWRTKEYFEECVWENYAREHGWLFDGRDVEGSPDWGVCETAGIKMSPGKDMTVEEGLRWVLGILVEEWNRTSSGV